jgi:hypothetical protein
MGRVGSTNPVFASNLDSSDWNMLSCSIATQTPTGISDRQTDGRTGRRGSDAKVDRHKLKSTVLTDRHTQF